MKTNLPKKVLSVMSTFEEAGFEIYIVGGAVRDLLMKKIVYDWDFTTNATPEKVQKMFPDTFYTNEFGTVGLPPVKDGDRPYEITTFRTEHGYSDTRRPDKVKWGDNIEEDLKRRDFTINAIALSKDKKDFKLTDLFGGQKDLKAKLVRAVGDPNERFSEDALRMMRAARIATELNFKIEGKTLNAIKKNKKLIHKISKERIKDELFKILASEHPFEGMTLLKETQLSQEILPELEKAFGVEQKSPGRHHIYDVGTHSMLSLKNCPSTDPVVRFATLIHDIGKPQTRKVLKEGTVTFYNHELASARIAKKISHRLRFSKKEAEKFWRLVRFHQFTVDEKQTDSAIRRFIRKVSLELVPDMLDLRTGDRLGGGARETSWRLEDFKKRLVEVQKQPFAIRDLKISGVEVMKVLNLKPGPEVGEILQNLFDKVVEKKLENTKKALLEQLKTSK